MAVRFGIVGLGMGMNRAQQVHATPEAALVAVCDLDESRLSHASKEFGCATHTDYDDLIARADVDVIWIMLPSGVHAEFGSKAAEHGKHVVTTKPMDVTVEACDVLSGACDQHDVRLMVDFQERYHPSNRRIKKAIDEGLLGPPILGELRMKWWRGASYYHGWHGTWALDGGGSLANQGVHQLDLLQWFLGDVSSVWAHCGVYGGEEHGEVESEDLVHAHVQFESGAVGSILTTTTSPKSQQTQIQIHGVKGVIGTGPDVWEFVDEGIDVDVESGPANATEDCIAMVEQGRPPACDGAEGRKSVELFNAIYQSTRDGHVVELPL